MKRIRNQSSVQAAHDFIVNTISSKLRKELEDRPVNESFHAMSPDERLTRCNRMLVQEAFHGDAGYAIDALLELSLAIATRERQRQQEGTTT